MEPKAHDVRPPPGSQPGAGLRIVLAYDLSPFAERAAALIGSTTWPAGTSVRIVTSPLGIGPPISSFASFSQADAHGRDVRRSIESAHARLALEYGDAGLAVETVSLPGRPGGAIVADAEEVGADLIVAGAPEHGPIAASLLGSVSTELVETAPCSIFIARSSAVSKVLLATDGSELAHAATSLVAGWPMFADSLVQVVGVGASVPRYAGVVLSRDERRAAYRETLEEATADADLAVDEAVEQLAASGRTVEVQVRLGDPASEIVAAARDWPADIVVIGSHGQPLLRRLLLGSVARTVLHSVGSSVLIARPGGTRQRSSAG